MNFSGASKNIDNFLDLNLEPISDYFFHLLITIIMTYSIIYVIRFTVHQIFKRTNFIEKKIELTIESTIANTSNYVAFFIILLAAMQPFVDLKQLMVAGGVLGIVIGFGAQSLIKDILTGFFLLFEQQFQKGDFVHINESIEGGTIEEVGFRVVKLRLVNGKLVTVPNGEIRKVINGNVEKRRIYESVIISFREEPMKAKRVLEELCDELNEKHLEYLKVDKNGEYEEKYRVHGLSSLDFSPIGYRFSIVATVKDTEYMAAVQEVKELMAQKLYEQHIKLSEYQVFYKTRI